MNCTDMTKQSTMTIDLNNMSLDTKKFLYDSYFSSKTNTSQSFNHKIELLTLLGYLTQQLKKRVPDTFRNSYDVLKKYVLVGNILEQADEDYISGLSIVCDDLLYGVQDIDPPTQYSNSAEIKNRLKELISGWLPF